MNALEELSLKNKLSKEDMVLHLKEIHSEHFHSDKVWDSISKQPTNYKSQREEELNQLLEKKRKLKKELRAIKKKNLLL